MDSSIGRTFSSGVFQARNDIPNYNRFVFGVDYTEAFALALLKQEAPNLYQEYQDILSGNKTMKSKRTLDFTRQGKGVIKAIKSTPAVEAQQFLSQVSGQLLWSLLKIPVTLQTYDENGHLVTQDFALQRNQVNYVDEWICETGNIAAPYYSDNGITLIPLQLTNSSIYANLKRAIETGEWWSVVSQKIHFDIGAEKTDTNGKGEVKVYYMPPGENFIYSWSNLEMNQNANYSTPFAYADGKTAVWIKLSNRIGNNGEYQSVRNTIERVNTSNIVNSAGIIAILSNRRDQFGKNPCLEQIPNNILTSLDQIEQIVPDGSCRVTAVIQTRGDNPNSQADEVYRQIGRMLIDGEIATGDGSGSGQSSEIISLMEQPKGIQSNIVWTKKPQKTSINYEDGSSAERQEYELGITVDNQTLSNLRTAVTNKTWYEMSGFEENNTFRSVNMISLKNQIAINGSWDCWTQNISGAWYETRGWAGLLPQIISNTDSVSITVPDPSNRYSRILLGQANFPIIYASAITSAAQGYNITSAFNINGLVFLGGGALSLHEAIGGTAVFGCTQTSGTSTANGSILQSTGNSLTQSPNYYIQSAPLDSNWSFKSLWSKVKNIAKKVIPVIDKIVDIIGSENEQIFVSSPTLDLRNTPAFSSVQTIDETDLSILKQFVGFPTLSGYQNPPQPTWTDGPNLERFSIISPVPVSQSSFYNMTFSFDIIPDLLFLHAPFENSSSPDIISLGIAMDICPIPYITTVNPSDFTIGDILNPNNTCFLGDLTSHLHSFTCKCEQIKPSTVSQAPNISIIELSSSASSSPYEYRSTPPPLAPVTGATLVTGQDYHCSVSCNFLPPQQIGSTSITSNTILHLGFLIGYTLSNSYQLHIKGDLQRNIYFACVPNEASAGGNNRYVWNSNGSLYPALQTLNSPASNAFFHISNVVMNTSFISTTENPQQAV